MGYAREDHHKICGLLGRPQYVAPDEEMPDWCVELREGREAQSILMICLPKQMDEQEAKQEIKRSIHEWGIGPPSHRVHKAYAK